MTGPTSPETDSDQAAAKDAGGFVPLCAPDIQTLAKRSDFLAAARARHRATPGFVVQARQRTTPDAATAPIRVGFTCSKKVGNAVARNRAKRRLRAIARAVLPEHGRAGWDYVLIGRLDKTASRDFAVMQRDLTDALEKLHGNGR